MDPLWRLRGGEKLSRAPSLKGNILANIFGRGWASVNFIVFTPVYLHLMGIEAYGIVGFFATLQTVMFLLDVGLGASLNRELARATADAGEADGMGDLLRTLEVSYLVFSAAIFALVFFASAPISVHWLHGEHFTHQELRQIVILMGVALAVQFPNHLFENGLYGLQKQVLANGIASLFVLLRYGGAALFLWAYEPTVEVFFVWFILIVIVQTLVTRRLLWRALGQRRKPPRIDLKALTDIRRFAMGMFGLSAVGTLYLQADKVILSSLLTLREYGFYMVAATVAAGLRIFISPIYNAFFPRFAQLVKTSENEALRVYYHRGCQLVAVFTVPTACAVMVFAPQILQIWTNDAAVARESGNVLRLLMASVLINALFSIPMALQIAHGRVGLLIKLRGFTLAMLVPVLIFATDAYGMQGAAASLVVLEAIYVGWGIVLMHGRFPTGSMRTWMVEDNLLPAAAALVMVTLMSLIHLRVDSAANKLSAAGLILVTVLLAMGGSTFAVPWLRRMVVRHCRRYLGFG